MPTLGGRIRLRNPPPVSSLFVVHFSNTKYSLGVTLDDLKVELAQADAALSKSGISYTHETTPAQFISQALEVEEQQ